MVDGLLRSFFVVVWKTWRVNIYTSKSFKHLPSDFLRQFEVWSAEAGVSRVKITTLDPPASFLRWRNPQLMAFTKMTRWVWWKQQLPIFQYRGVHTIHHQPDYYRTILQQKSIQKNPSLMNSELFFFYHGFFHSHLQVLGLGMHHLWATQELVWCLCRQLLESCPAAISKWRIAALRLRKIDVHSGWIAVDIMWHLCWNLLFKQIVHH